MELTDITREEERDMKKNEKQVITILGVAIAIVAIALIAMLITSRDTSDNSKTSLKDAVQEETENKNSSNGKDVSKDDKGSVSESDAAQSGDNMTTAQTTTEKKTEATTAKKNNDSSSIMDADDGYIFPDVDSSYISKSSIKALSDEELQYAINEVYARNGLKFSKSKNKERFEKKAWYTGTIDDQDTISLNKYEKKNVDNMAAEAKKRGLR